MSADLKINDNQQVETIAEVAKEVEVPPQDKKAKKVAEEVLQEQNNEAQELASSDEKASLEDAENKA